MRVLFTVCGALRLLIFCVFPLETPLLKRPPEQGRGAVWCPGRKGAVTRLREEIRVRQAAGRDSGVNESVRTLNEDVSFTETHTLMR